MPERSLPKRFTIGVIIAADLINVRLFMTVKIREPD
jgi:hypothetical protein